MIIKMKMKMNIDSNSAYLDYIDPTIYILIMNSEAQKSIGILRRKLKGKSLEIFDTIVLWRCCIELMKIKAEDAWNNRVTPEVDWSIIEKRNKFIKLEKESENQLETYLNSIDNLEFFSCFADITYKLANIEIERMIKNHSDSLNTWREWHDYLIRKNKNKRRGEQIKEMLRSILGNRIDDIDKIEEEYKKEIDRVEGGSGMIFINLEDEIDMSSVEYGDYEIISTRGINNQLPTIIKEGDKFIFINRNEYTLRQYYELKKSEIDSGWLVSKDLLKEILIIYLIKRAQKGDSYAYNKLFSFYKESAKKLALGFLKLKACKYSKYKEFAQSGKLSNQNAESAIYSILMAFLKGDNPHNLFKYIDVKPSERKDLLFLNKKPANILYNSYQNLYEMIDQQKVSLENELKELKNKGKDFKYRAKIAKKIETKKYYLDKLWGISQGALVRKNSSYTLYSLINPISLLEISPKYNKYLYQPSNKNNLTTWLFGSKDKKFRGMLWIALEDWFKGQTHVENGKRLIDKQDYSGDYFDERKYNDNENADSLQD